MCNFKTQAGTVAHTCNPTLRGQGEQITRAQEIETRSTQKINLKKISQVWWHMPVVPATQEAAVGGSLEPRRLRLQ